MVCTRLTPFVIILQCQPSAPRAPGKPGLVPVPPQLRARRPRSRAASHRVAAPRVLYQLLQDRRRQQQRPGFDGVVVPHVSPRKRPVNRQGADLVVEVIDLFGQVSQARAVSRRARWVGLGLKQGLAARYAVFSLYNPRA